MAVIVNDYVILQQLEAVIGQIAFQGAWLVSLYVNYWPPTTGDTIVRYQECTWPGYSAQKLQPQNWTVQIADPGVRKATYPLVTFNFDASGQAQQTIFGYYVSDGNGNVYLAELFPAPYPIPPQGGSLPLMLTWTQEQCPLT
jgi:hypothetical protein